MSLSVAISFCLWIPQCPHRVPYQGLHACCFLAGFALLSVPDPPSPMLAVLFYLLAAPLMPQGLSSTSMDMHQDRAFSILEHPCELALILFALHVFKSSTISPLRLLAFSWLR